MARRATISFTGAVTPELATQFHLVWNELRRVRLDEVSLFLSSRGGDLTSGLAIYNLLASLPCRLRMVNLGQCGSIAATIYLAGHVRQAMPLANFFLHAAFYVEGPKEGEISPNTALILAPFRDRLGWDQARLDQYFGATAETYLGVEQARALGIVNDAAPVPINPRDPGIVLDPQAKELPTLARFADELRAAPTRRRAPLPRR